MLPMFLGKIGATEIILIIALIVILFGGKKIPEMMRGIGRGMCEFKDAVNKDYDAEKETAQSEPDHAAPTTDKQPDTQAGEKDKGAKKGSGTKRTKSKGPEKNAE